MNKNDIDIYKKKVQKHNKITNFKKKLQVYNTNENYNSISFIIKTLSQT